MSSKFWYPNELSFSNNDGRRNVTGYAAVFYDPQNPGPTSYRPEKDVELRFARGAFDQALRNGNPIQALLFHDMDRPVGVRGQNLHLEADYRGLKFSIDLPDTHDGREVWAMIGGNGGPKLIQGMSFTGDREGGFDKWTQENGKDVLTFFRWGAISEITFTNNPAMTGTSIAWGNEAKKAIAAEHKYEIAKRYQDELQKK